jgi:hypothetical protein
MLARVKIMPWLLAAFAVACSAGAADVQVDELRCEYLSTVILPCADPSLIQEGGQQATAKTPGLRTISAGEGASVMEVDSGAYHFILPQPGS